MALIARARKKRKPVAEMNVVPYIDVMLVLLVIFMVTAPMLNQGVKVDLPKVSSEALPQDNNTQVLTISIKADKTYYWNLGSEVDTQKQQDKALTLPAMTDAVTKIIRSGNEGGKPAYIGGVSGVVERNTMRYYLAIDSYLKEMDAPNGEQQERRLRSWFSATERYARQLHEVEREDYMEMKRAEIKRQQQPR